MNRFQIFLNVWAIVGPLVGILLGSWLTTKNQRRHWLLDNKRSEYRELLTTIADAGSKLLVFWGRNPVVASGEEQFMIGETARQSVPLDLTGKICTKWNERESTWRKIGSCPSRGTSQSKS